MNIAMWQAFLSPVWTRHKGLGNIHRNPYQDIKQNGFVSDFEIEEKALGPYFSIVSMSLLSRGNMKFYSKRGDQNKFDQNYNLSDNRSQIEWMIETGIQINSGGFPHLFRGVNHFNMYEISHFSKRFFIRIFRNF